MDEGMRVKEGENTMGNYTREEVLQMAEDEDVEFIRLQFTDMFGTLKNIAITARELPRALDNEYVVDSSYIAGIAGEKEPDMYLHPDYNTFTILPWRPQQGKVARLICDVYTVDGKPFQGDPRNVLKRAIQEAADMGYVFDVGPECEFFLFHTDDNGLPTERLVERDEKIRANQMPRSEFRAKCMKTIGTYEGEFKELWSRRGFFVDWNFEFQTVSDRAQRI